MKTFFLPGMGLLGQINKSLTVVWVQGRGLLKKEVKIKDQGAEHFKLLLVVKMYFRKKAVCSHVFTVGSKVSQRPGVPLAKVGQVGLEKWS